MAMSPDPLENRLDKLSKKCQNVPIGVHMKSWRPSQFGTILQSEFNFQNVLYLDSFCPWNQSNVVAQWRTLGILGFGPQSTSLTFHAFHMQSNLPLIHVSNSENENEHTSWCSINSSNASIISLIQNGCTFCIEVVGMVIFERMMSSSHLMELLGDVGHVQSHFNPFRDSVSIGVRQVHGLCQVYHRLRNQFRCT